MARNNYKVIADNFDGRLLFLKIAVRMLLFPSEVYVIHKDSSPFDPLELPGATMQDVLYCARVGFWHAIHGVTVVLGGRVVLPCDWKYIAYVSKGEE